MSMTLLPAASSASSNSLSGGDSLAMTGATRSENSIGYLVSSIEESRQWQFHWYALCIVKIVLRFRILVVTVTVIVFARPTNALETDQFTTPPRPLKDFGPILEGHVSE